MHWEWLVPVFFLIVWIISSLIQGAERERTRMNRSRSLPGDRPPGERTPRRPVSDIDRFLEEVNRRRRQTAEQRPVPVGRERPSGTTIGPATSAARPRVSTRSATGRAARPVGSPSGKIPETLPVTETSAAAEVLAVASVLHATPVRSFPSAETAPPVGGGVEAAALPPLAELLAAPDNLRTAVILHEIFGPPRCRRPAIG